MRSQSFRSGSQSFKSDSSTTTEEDIDEREKEKKSNRHIKASISLKKIREEKNNEDSDSSSSSDQDTDLEENEKTIIHITSQSKLTSLNRQPEKKTVKPDLEEKNPLSQPDPISLKITIPHNNTPIKPLPRQYIFRKILATQAGLSSFFTFNFMTHTLLSYLKVSQSYSTYISPVMGGLAGTFSAASFLLGTNDFIDKNSFAEEKTKLLAEMKGMEDDISLLKKNFNIYKGNLDKIKQLQNLKKFLEDKNPNKDQAIELLFQKNPAYAFKTDSPKKNRPKKKINERNSHSVNKTSLLDNICLLESPVSGYFSGSSIIKNTFDAMNNVLKVSTSVKEGIKIAGGLGMSALYSISTFYANKERKNNHQEFIDDQKLIKEQQDELTFQTNNLKKKINKIKKPKKLHISTLMSRRSSAPAAHFSRSSLLSRAQQATSPVSYIETTSSPVNSPIATTATPSVISPPFLTSATSNLETKLLVDEKKPFNSPPALEPSSPISPQDGFVSATSPSFFSKQPSPFLPENNSVLALENKPIEPALNEPEGHFAQLSKKWDTFKTNHLRLFRAADMSQAALLGFAAGYAMTASFLPFMPTIIISSLTSGFFTLSSYREAGEFTVSQRLFDAEKRILEQQNERLKKDLNQLHKKLMSSNVQIKQEYNELKNDVQQKIIAPRIEETHPSSSDTAKITLPRLRSFFNFKPVAENKHYPKTPEKDSRQSNDKLTKSGSCTF